MKATVQAKAGQGVRAKHIPQRTCIGCRESSAKREFVRIVRTVEGTVEVDPTGKKSGRGAYLCRRRPCWETALKRDAVGRALKIALPAEDRVALSAFAATLPDTAPSPVAQVAAS